MNKLSVAMVAAILISATITGAEAGDLFNENLDEIKGAINEQIDYKITALEDFKIDIDEYPIDSGDKDLIEGMVDEVITGLKDMKKIVNSIDDVSDVRGALSEINEYIKSNRGKIVEAAKKLRQALNDEVVDAMELAVDEMEEVLEEIEENCPELESELRAIKGDVEDLATDVADLVEDALTGGDPDQIAQNAEELYSVVDSIYLDVETAVMQCEYYY